VGRHDHGEARPGQLGDGADHQHAVAVVEVRGRLVEQQYPGFLAQRPPDQGELAFTAADQRVGLIGQVREPEARHDAFGDRRVRRRW
jgi:hypothetical protein